MKTSKILAIGALSLVLAANAQATTVIRIGGSSAYRAAAVPSIESLLNSVVETAHSNDATTAAGANACNITGTLKSALKNGSTTILAAGSSVLIKCSWTGSVGGLDNVANSSVSSTRKFMVDSASGSVDMSNSANVAATEIPDIAFSDVWINSTGAALVDNLGNLKQCSADPVGVIPFKWLVAAGSGASSSLITNMTAQAVRSIAPSGAVPTPVLTGTDDGSGSLIYLTGRDPDSGTRITALGEAGYDPATSVVQYVASTDGVSQWDGKTGTPSSLILAPDSYINTHLISGGNSGFSSGGTLAAAVKNTPAGLTVVSYLSVGDAATALSGGGQATVTELTYNGVPFSVANVENGKYTFWSQEHMYYRAADAASKTGGHPYVGAFAEGLATATKAVATEPTGKYINMKDMQVTRASDADVVTHN